MTTMTLKGICKFSGLVLVFLTNSIHHAKAAEYSNIYFFGDSITDSGVYSPILSSLRANPTFCRFTTNPGTNWADNLGEKYGKIVTPAYGARNSLPAMAFDTIEGGNNFAVGSALTNSAPASTLYSEIPPVSAQVRAFLARGPLDHKALYCLSGGHNDVFAQVSAVSMADGIIAVEKAANELATQASILQSAGARNVIVVGIVDISKAPIASSENITSRLKALVTTFNTTLSTDLTGKNLLYFETWKLFDSVLYNPGAYGFTNTTLPALPYPNSSLGQAAPTDTEGFLFADSKHPSAIFHLILSDWIYSTLEGVSSIGLLSKLPMEHSSEQCQAIDDQMNAFQNYGYNGQGFFISGNYSSSRSDALASQPSYEGSKNNFILGYEHAVNEQFFGGLTIGYEYAPFELGTNTCSVLYKELALSAFASKKFEDFYVNALASYSWLDYESQRNISLGTLFRTSEQGSTHGNHFGIKTQIGCNLLSSKIVHGPFVGLAFEHVNVDGFNETSNSFTALTFGEQTRESFRSLLGWKTTTQARWLNVTVRPYAQVTYNYEYEMSDRSYYAGFVGGTSTMELPITNQTGGYGTLLAGVTAELGKDILLRIGTSTTIAQSGSHNSGINVTVNAPF